MTNSVEEYWDADGFSLHTFAWAIETSGQHVRGVAPLKGGDIPVAMRPGDIWRPKVAGPRIISLPGWVRGCNPDGTVDVGADKSVLLTDNYNKVKQALWRTDRQISLTKRWKTASGLKSATALAEYNAGLDNSQVIDTNRAPQALKFTVDMKLADPYFYGQQIVLPNATGARTITNPGDDVARKIVLTFAHAGSITNSTTGRTMTVSAAGEYDVKTFDAPAGHLKDVTVSGQIAEAFWFTLAAGPNAITSTTGVQISYWPVYF